MILAKATLSGVVLASSIAASAHAEPVDLNELVDIQASADWQECVALSPGREARRCTSALIGNHNWKLTVVHARGITGANDLFVPNATEILTQLVSECELGRAVLDYHTDGVASVYLGDPDLSPVQVRCVKEYERPGLRLERNRT